MACLIGTRGGADFMVKSRSLVGTAVLSYLLGLRHALGMRNLLTFKTVGGALSIPGGAFIEWLVELTFIFSGVDCRCGPYIGVYLEVVTGNYLYLYRWCSYIGN